MMLVECCSQERSYLRFYGLLGQVGPPVTPSRSVVILSLSLPPSLLRGSVCSAKVGWRPLTVSSRSRYVHTHVSMHCIYLF